MLTVVHHTSGAPGCGTRDTKGAWAPEPATPRLVSMKLTIALPIVVAAAVALAGALAGPPRWHPAPLSPVGLTDGS